MPLNGTRRTRMGQGLKRGISAYKRGLKTHMMKNRARSDKKSAEYLKKTRGASGMQGMLRKFISSNIKRSLKTRK